MGGEDFNCYSIGEIVKPLVSRLGGVKDGTLDVGQRVSGKRWAQSSRLSPTHSERLNRALQELDPSAFKVHILLWQWRGAPARGHLPFFTVHSLANFTHLSRPTVRSALRKLVSKGWIEKLGYNVHKKNELYRLIPISEIHD